MLKTTKTIVAFDERQSSDIDEIKKGLSQDSQGLIVNKELFLIALGIGFEAGIQESDFRRSNNGVRLDYIRKDPESMMLILAVHLKTSGNVDSIADFDGALSTAERFAATGIKILREAQKNSPDLRLWLQAQVNNSYMRISND